MTTVYTDGACVGNPGPGGWAWAVPGGRYASGAERAATNQRMEIRAVLEAVRALDGPLDVVSDSTYVVNCFRDRWWEGWLARDWRNASRQPVANRDLWEPLIDAYRSRTITFRWVKGHADDATNDLVDRLATDAARAQTGRTGDGVPSSLGPSDRDARLPAGRLVVVGGVKPTVLGGYDENPVSARVAERLTEILEAKRATHPDLVVLTGLGLGAEQLGARAASQAGVPYVAVLPYPDQESVWPPASQRAYRHLLDSAIATVLLQTNRPASPQQAGAAMSRRDGWVARQADEAVVVWDGKDRLVQRLVRNLEDRLGSDVWIVDPRE